MKRKIILMSVLILGIAMLTSCGKKDKDVSNDEKATETSVLKYLPGTWQVTHYLDEGEKEAVPYEALLTFGKEDPENPSTGSFNMKYNGSKYISNGRWSMEYVPNDPGVYIRLENAAGYMITLDGTDAEFYITKISATYMEAMEGNDEDEGFALKKVE